MQPRYVRFARALALLTGTALGGCTASHEGPEPNPDLESDAAEVDAGFAATPDAGPTDDAGDPLLVADANADARLCMCDCYSGPNPCFDPVACGCIGGGGPLHPPELAS